jgi:hypothetical protein
MEDEIQARAAAEARRANKPIPKLANIVLMLLKSLYELVQSSHLFWRKQSETMIENLHFERSHADFCLYSQWVNEKLFLFISWVDDLIMACSDPEVIKRKKDMLKETFDNDEVGPMK